MSTNNVNSAPVAPAAPVVVRGFWPTLRYMLVRTMGMGVKGIDNVELTLDITNNLLRAVEEKTGTIRTAAEIEAQKQRIIHEAELDALQVQLMNTKNRIQSEEPNQPKAKKGGKSKRSKKAKKSKS